MSQPLRSRADLPLLALLALLGFFIALLGLTPRASGQVFYTPRAVLQSFFPGSQRVTYHRFDLVPEVRKKLAQHLGSPLAKDSYNFYYALTGETLDGYALIDEVMGQYMPITYAVKFSPKGDVQRLEIMSYQEKYGSEVCDARFRKQFVGKTAADPLMLDNDVVAVSGATISSRALTLGTRRALFLLEELVLRKPPAAPPPS